MLTFKEWIQENHADFIDEGRLSDLGKAAVTTAGLLGGTLFPGQSVAADNNRPVMQQVSSNQSQPNYLQNHSKKPFNPKIGPQPANKKANALQIWKYQVRYVQDVESKMRRGMKPTPEYIILRQYYNNTLPDAPVIE
jgi:hypothetical protein